MLFRSSLRPTRGILPISMAIYKSLPKNIITPVQNASEAAAVSGIKVWPLKTLRETVEFIHNPDTVKPVKMDLEGLFRQNSNYPVDFSEVK